MKRTAICDVLCILIGLIGVVGFLLALFGFSQKPSIPVSSRTLVTAAHLGDIDGYECVFVDEETDYAIYVQENYIANGLSVGDVVSLAGTTGTVGSVSEAEFSVVVDNVSKIVPGVSGEPVCFDSTPVGFISGWDGQGAIRCIFY